MHVDERKNKQLMKESCKCATLLYSTKEKKVEASQFSE